MQVGPLSSSKNLLFFNFSMPDAALHKFLVLKSTVDLVLSNVVAMLFLLMLLLLLLLLLAPLGALAGLDF